MSVEPLFEVHAEWATDGSAQEEWRCVSLPGAIAAAWHVLACGAPTVRISQATEEAMARYRDELQLDPGGAQSIPRDPAVETEIARVLKEELEAAGERLEWEGVLRPYRGGR